MRTAKINATHLVEQQLGSLQQVEYNCSKKQSSFSFFQLLQQAEVLQSRGTYFQESPGQWSTLLNQLDNLTENSALQSLTSQFPECTCRRILAYRYVEI